MTILALPEASLYYVGMKQPKKKPAVRGVQTGLHLSYVCQNAGTIPEGLFGRQIVWKSAKG